jgi:hypothetical protein
MKIKDWFAREDIFKVNAAISHTEDRWPNLDRVMAALESFPRTSVSKSGASIFMGWRSLSHEWIYHHGVCITDSRNGKGRYGFHDCSIEDIPRLRLVPVYNVGDIPESAAFLDVLESAGIKRVDIGCVMVNPKIK